MGTILRVNTEIWCVIWVKEKEWARTGRCAEDTLVAMRLIHLKSRFENGELVSSLWQWYSLLFSYIFGIKTQEKHRYSRTDCTRSNARVVIFCIAGLFICQKFQRKSSPIRWRFQKSQCQLCLFSRVGKAKRPNYFQNADFVMLLKIIQSSQATNVNCCLVIRAFPIVCVCVCVWRIRSYKLFSEVISIESTVSHAKWKWHRVFPLPHIIAMPTFALCIIYACHRKRT